MTNFFKSNNWKFSNTNDWLWSHLIFLGIFSVIAYIVSITLGVVLKMNDLIYPVIFCSLWFVLMQFFYWIIILIIQWGLDKYLKRKYIIAISISLYTIHSILYVIPLMIMVLVDVYVNTVFNFYMIIAVYLYYLIIKFTVEYLYNKYFSQRKKQKNPS